MILPLLLSNYKDQSLAKQLHMIFLHSVKGF